VVIVDSENRIFDDDFDYLNGTGELNVKITIDSVIDHLKSSATSKNNIDKETLASLSLLLAGPNFFENASDFKLSKLT
jgi:hypothetical protein